MSLKLLMAFALEKDCKKLTVFGDSKNAINWINGTQRCNNIRLAYIVEDIKNTTEIFLFFFPVNMSTGKEMKKHTRHPKKALTWKWALEDHRVLK